jgi:hypothetical protein
LIALISLLNLCALITNLSCLPPAATGSLTCANTIGRGGPRGIGGRGGKGGPSEEYLRTSQPTSFSGVKRRVYNFIVAISKMSKGDKETAAERLEPLKLVAKDKAKITDDTAARLLGGSADVRAEQLARRFLEKDYRRFGCMAPVGEKNGAGYDEAIASFLAIRAGIDASSANTGDALPVHVIFTQGLVSALSVYNEPAWAQFNADKNEGNCNGFKLKKASAEGVADALSPSSDATERRDSDSVVIFA